MANGGGPAFPGTFREDAPAGGSFLVQRGGMTLRDWFAGQAMLGLVARYGNDGEIAAAKIAYEFADAMLAARVPPEGETT